MEEFKYFKLDEFKCTHTGKNYISKEFVAKLDELAERIAEDLKTQGVPRFPLIINSGYRDKTHPDEVSKDKPGRHNQGIAADIRANNWHAYLIMKHAFAMGFKGIARGDGFVHIDFRQTKFGASWTY